MPFLTRIAAFFVWALAAIVIQRSFLLNVFAIIQWSSSAVNASDETWPSTKATQTCTGLREQLGSEVVQVNGETSYRSAIQNPASLFNTIQRPACVVVPRKDVDIQLAMAAIYRDRVRYAVMSGGHTGMTGWNTVQDGVLIYFEKMNNITYDANRNRATIQPGVRWGEALEQLEPYGVAPMGGRLGNIGTGLLLGGGISYLAPENGWSTDGITEMDVVLVNGQQVTATATNRYSDLFRALKGGGSRFGIVTRFEVEPVRLGRSTDKNWYGGIVLVTVDELIRAAHKFTETNKDPKAAILVVLGFVMQDDRPVASNIVAYFYRGSSLPKGAFGDLLDIPSVFKSLGPLSYFDAANIFGSGEYRASGERFSGTSFAGDPERCLKAYRDFQRFAHESAHLVNSTVFALTPIPLHQIQVAKRRGGNAMDAAEVPYLSAHWHTVFLAGQEEIPSKVELGLQWLMRQNPPSPGAPLDMNESDATQNVYATYGDYEFLRRVYRKYDPTRFNVRYSQGPIGL
ncbi:Bifunctional solanapyrone synthase [Leucoagaricus sp. SymC.cos]|nr:Bifunctional solanapyrone synthase [Leucoagaricus sp. SymC.cos]